MLLSPSEKYYFNGTTIYFDFVLMDDTGVVPAADADESGNITVTAYDSAKSPDAVTETVTQINGALYEVQIPYSELNRGAGDGIWRFEITHSGNYVAQPYAVSIPIAREVGAVNTGGAATTTTTTEVDFANQDETTDHYKGSYMLILNGSNAGEVAKITGSVLSNTRIELSHDALSAGLSNGDDVLIINS